MWLKFFLYFAIAIHCVTTYRLTIDSGEINGFTEQHGKALIYQFRNIPYAKPPVGRLRFQKPQPHGQWTGVRNASSYGPSCIQAKTNIIDGVNTDLERSEDCLHLNVFVPNNMLKRPTKTVMVWIHGGAYIMGAGTSYDGTPLALTGDVIVVTINYRLGVLGFLTTGDQHAPGNYGLWDQVLALKWVHNNIAYFGGNPNDVTVFGESAGAVSANFLAMIPQNKGLFKRIILQSGAANGHVSSMDVPLLTSRKISLLLGCDNTSSQATVECLQTVSTNKVLHAQSDRSVVRTDRLYFGYEFGPIVDGDLITKSPAELLNDPSSDGYRFFRSLDVMSGNNNNEGSLFARFIFPILGHMEGFDSAGGYLPEIPMCRNVSTSVATELFSEYTANTIPAALALCAIYRATTDRERAMKACDMYNDAFYLVPAIRALDAHAQNNSLTQTYQYIFNRPGTFGSPPWFTGSAHAAELSFLFNSDVISSQPPMINTDRQLSIGMIQAWTNFAKTGYVIKFSTSVKLHVINVYMFYEENMNHGLTGAWKISIMKLFNISQAIINQ